MDKQRIRENLQSIEQVAGRAGSDTIRLWESYRDQAYLWRSLALLQMPATALSIVLALILYATADTVVEVPDMPLPGYYSVEKLPDAQFITFAEQVVNLIASYQPTNARSQFETARNFLWEPALSQFETEILEKELRAVEETRRSQLFLIDQSLTKVSRYPEEDYVIVRIPGTRQKLIDRKALDQEQFAYYVKMTTIPRNVNNEYGIVITDMRLSPIDLNAERKKEKQDLNIRFKRRAGGDL